MKDPMPRRLRWDPSGYHPYKAMDGNGLADPNYRCLTCGSKEGAHLHSRHEPQKPPHW